MVPYRSREKSRKSRAPSFKTRAVQSKVDGDVVADHMLVIPASGTVVIQAGKRRFARVTVK